MAPKLADALEQLLGKKGEGLLAEQVRDLRVAGAQLHGHGSNYYTEPRPDGPWGQGHRTIELLSGHLFVDVLDSRIVMIEVLHRQFLKMV